MTTFDAHAHETVLLRRQLDAHERELDHRANVIAAQADRIAELEADARKRELHPMSVLWEMRNQLTLNPRSTSFPCAPQTLLPDEPGPC